MKLNFLKYEGAGNDFILIDNRNKAFSENLNTESIKKLCDRHFGIGADGLMILELIKDFDFEMRYFNADGREGSMCGNGGRCIVAFAKHLNLIQKETNFLAVDGPHYARISENGNWVDKLDSKDVYQDGKNIRNNSTYLKEGINVNFVEDFGDHYFVRTFERGVEDETFACGTGVTAVSMAMAKKKELRGEIKNSIKVPGGDLSVRFNYDGTSFQNVFLEGPATFVFEGTVEI